MVLLELAGGFIGKGAQIGAKKLNEWLEKKGIVKPGAKPHERADFYVDLAAVGAAAYFALFGKGAVQKIAEGALTKLAPDMLDYVLEYLGAEARPAGARVIYVPASPAGGGGGEQAQGEQAVTETEEVYGA